jgi:hypothetical protein
MKPATRLLRAAALTSGQEKKTAREARGRKISSRFMSAFDCRLNHSILYVDVRKSRHKALSGKIPPKYPIF